MSLVMFYQPEPAGELVDEERPARFKTLRLSAPSASMRGRAPRRCRDRWIRSTGPTGCSRWILFGTAVKFAAAAVHLVRQPLQRAASRREIRFGFQNSIHLRVDGRRCRCVWISVVVLWRSGINSQVTSLGTRTGSRISSSIYERWATRSTTPKCKPHKGEVRGGSQKGDQEAAVVQRPDQDVDPVQRDQGQEVLVRFFFILGSWNQEIGAAIRKLED